MVNSAGSKVIYYFTGTGNCLAVARMVADRLGYRTIAIADVINKQIIRSEADTIGIVFPAYLSAMNGIPLMVERFITKLKDLESKHLFAICTCGGYEIVNAVPSLINFHRFVRAQGGMLWREYSVRLPMNNLDYDHIPVPIETDSAVIIHQAEAQIEDICQRIVLGQQGKSHLSRRLFNVLMAPLFALMARSTLKELRMLAHESKDSSLGFRELIPLTDRSIRVGEDCTGCGTCAKVCPAGNIEIVAGRPVFQQCCEMCFACDEWCPQGVVCHWGRPNGVKYHHPAVCARDLSRRNDQDGNV